MDLGVAAIARSPAIATIAATAAVVSILVLLLLLVLNIGLEGFTFAFAARRSHVLIFIDGVLVLISSHNLIAEIR